VKRKEKKGGSETSRGEKGERMLGEGEKKAV